MSDYGEPKPLRGGPIAKGGLSMRDRHQRPQLAPEDRPMRGLVVNTRMVGDADNIRGYGVECDVVVVKTGVAVYNVPVVQKAGVNNVHDLWVPRRTTRVVSAAGGVLNLQEQLSRRGSFQGAPTPLSDVDGDMVLIDFIEGNPDFPIITHSLPHERANRRVRSGQGWREGSVAERGEPREDEYYTHHYGVELRINEQGDVLIDTVGAYSDPATEDASVMSGQVRFRIKDSQRFTVSIGDDEDVLEVWKDTGTGQLRVDLGEGATERVVLGDTFKTYLDAQLSKINTFWTAVFNAHKHTGVTTGMGTSGTPDTTQTDSLDSVPDNALSDLAKSKKS